MAPVSSEASPLVKNQSSPPATSTWNAVRVIGAAAAIIVGGGLIYYATRSTTNTSTSSFCDPKVKHEFGYIQLPHKVNDHYFYSYFESRNNPATDPLVVWLEGGPGSSSTFTMFSMNGPCFVSDDFRTVLNPYSWTTNANMLWLDQPTGVGFSFGDAADDDSNEDDVGRNFYGFMQGFLRKHPELASTPFYIAGQSFGGHYVPAAANYIVRHQANQSTSADATHINLRGIWIGNGLTDTVMQFPKTVDMVDAVAQQYNITLASPATVVQMRKDAAVVAHLIQECQSPNATQVCLDAMSIWSEKLVGPMIENPLRNPYDVRDACSPACDDYGMAKLGTYLNLPHVQKALGVNQTYAWNNATVAAEFMVDAGKSVVHLVPEILAAGVRVVLNVGDADLMCDWLGNDAWAKSLVWPGKASYNAAPVTPLVVDGANAGQVRSAHGLSFVRIFNSGHCVPANQPVVSLELFNRFLQNAALDK
ncbi:Aste57867_10947 [Aphanomyces stellatus]|uniref:Aste57867_10947 protein n=1 Tax=Aphanomyces stellatus TaxID=120398 RepID=A0A485KRS9_9STRA|nr:hypothetical protein As57867_010907 [Aphanomyces stellatus]VFT87815.1 Aste57867_10947 [Aphanomyces stellatus]